MIAEALDSGVLTVGGVVGLLVVGCGGAWWASAAWSLLKRIERDQGAGLKAVKELGRQLDDHRVEDDAKHGSLGGRIARVEGVLERDGVLTPIRDTAPHDHLRGDTPRRRQHADTGDTGSGFER